MLFVHRGSSSRAVIVAISTFVNQYRFVSGDPTNNLSKRGLRFLDLSNNHNYRVFHRSMGDAVLGSKSFDRNVEAVSNGFRVGMMWGFLICRID